MSNIGLFIGRFQPFHNGHLHAVKFILNEVDLAIICVGSAQYSHTFKNPFTAGERIEMIKAALAEAQITADKYMIIPIPDIHDNRLWVDHVVTLVPSFNIVYTNDPLSTVLFKEKNYLVKPIPFLERDRYEGTWIRKLMVSNGEWNSLVPKAVVNFIHKIKGVERLKLIHKTDRVRETI